MEASGHPCLYCGEPIGLYEPLIVVEHEGERETSFSREPELLRQHASVLMVHRRCAPERWGQELTG